MFPIGDTPKPQVRAEAAERGLRVADKPDSHDICFIPSGDTRRFLAERIGVRPGAIVDAVTGERLADHDGVHGFTVGQRKGLGVDAPADDGRPRYVPGIEPASGTVRVGPATALDVRSIDGVAPVWAAGAAPGESFDCMVQVRAHGGLAPAAVRVTAEGVRSSWASRCAGSRPARRRRSTQTTWCWAALGSLPPPPDQAARTLS